MGPDAHPLSSRSADTARCDPSIEDYLDHLYAPMVGRVPYPMRAALRAELHSHREALIDAERELGKAPDEAVCAALAQFGDPRALAREWLRSWQRATPTGPASAAWQSTLLAFGCFGAAVGVAMAIRVTQLPIPVSWPFLLNALLPLLAGLAVGLLAPARHALGTFYALVGLIVLTTLGSLYVFSGPDLCEASAGAPPRVDASPTAPRP